MATRPDAQAGGPARILSLFARADVQLVLLAAVTICLYLWGLALPYNIFDLWRRGRINLGAATLYQPGPMARISLALAGSSLAYWLALRVIRHHSSRTLW